jgi:MoxR-like ATPase
MHSKFTHIIRHISQVLLGKEKHIKLATACMLANGHLLIEDLPGMGKTTLSYALANAFGLDYTRLQFTSDLLPADVVGVSIFNAQTQQFELHRGPIFTQLLLADEINRASPKSQSALLEAMEEKQVTIDGHTHALADPFFVIATQNPASQSGTYPLPESQLDRFLMRLHLGYPSPDAEFRMLLEQFDATRLTTEAQMTLDELRTAQQQVLDVHVSEAVAHYVIRLANYTREQPEFPNALSPRALKGLLKAAKAWAFLHERDYLIPEDVQEVLPSVAEHRIRSNLVDLNDDQMLSYLLLDAVDPLTLVSA